MYLDKSLALLKFETEDLSKVVSLKINAILTAKGSIKEEETWICNNLFNSLSSKY